MRIKNKLLALGAGLTLAGGLSLAAGAAPAMASTPLPAYPATTTLNLGSANCVTDDVILTEPSTSLTVTAGSNGSPVVYSQDTAGHVLDDLLGRSISRVNRIELALGEWHRSVHQLYRSDLSYWGTADSRKLPGAGLR